MKIFQPRPNKSPKIYGYTELSPEYDGLIKIGYTEREVKDSTHQTILFLHLGDNQILYGGSLQH